MGRRDQRARRCGRFAKCGPGDRIFFYHSGGISGVVGLATVRSEPRDDPKNPKSAVVDLEFAGRLEPPTTLAEIKQSKVVRRLGAGAPEPPFDHGRAAALSSSG